MRLATRVLFTWTRPPKRGYTGALAGATYIHNMEAKGAYMFVIHADSRAAMSYDFWVS